MNTPLLPDRYIVPARILLAVFTAVGIGGMLLYPDWFPKLTPLNLLLNFGVFLAFMPVISGAEVRFMLLVFAAGIGIELIGVDSGKLFGVYHYGDALGFKVKTVPLIIGINWLLLVCCTMSISVRLSSNIYLQSLAGAALMTGLDLLIEPLCSRFDFWYWAAGAAPLRNFIAWFVLSFFFQLAGNSMQVAKKNPLALFIFGMQLVFFTVLMLAR